MVQGCASPEGTTGHSTARNASLAAGFGEAVPATLLTGIAVLACRLLIAADRIAGGVESISLVQFNLNTNGFVSAAWQLSVGP
jgi:acetyl-CoA C-acetyltransferase